MKTWSSLILGILMIFGLSACGGGGSSDHKEPSKQTIPEKKPQPKSKSIRSTTIVDKTIYVEFKKPVSDGDIQKLTLNEKSRANKDKLILEDENGKKLNVKATLSYNNKLLRVTSSDMQPNKTYALTIPQTRAANGQKIVYKTSIRLTKTGQNVSYQSFDDGEYKIGKQRNFERKDDIVTDNVTNLKWQDDTHVNSVRLSQDEAKEYCKSLGNEWRLPNIEEFRTIIDYSIPNRAIDATFENIGAEGSKRYWTSTNNLQMPDFGVFVNFSFGTDDSSPRSNKYYVRCVKGDEFTKSNAEKKGDIVFDNDTGLTWKDEISTNKMTWDKALEYCKNLGENWRLPNIRELLSITTISQGETPSLKQGFEYRSTGQFWSSTTLITDINNAWGVDFYVGGDFIHEAKNEKNLVRCVRGYKVEDVITPEDDKIIEPPIANVKVTPQNATEIDEITLDASESEDGKGGDNLSYFWNEDDAILGETKVIKHLFTRGQHIITLTVTDNDSNKFSKKTFTINIAEVNPPIAKAKATPQNATEGDAITLDASESKDVNDGDNLSYEWIKNGVIISNEKISIQTFSKGTHLITLKVIDNITGKTSQNTLTVNVSKKQEIKPPIAKANISLLNTTEFNEITLDASESKDGNGGDNLNYEWIDNGSVLSNQKIFKSTFSLGKHNITLKVQDKTTNKTSETTAVITIKKANPPISKAQAVPQRAMEKTIVKFSGNSSKDGRGGENLSYEWSENLVVLSNNKSFQKSFTIKDTNNLTEVHDIILKVTDNITGKINISTVTVVVKRENKPPKAIIKAPVTVNEGDEVFLDASQSTDEDKSTLSYKWYDNNVYIGSDKIQRYIFKESSNKKHTITLAVVDKEGLGTSSQVKIKVNPAPKPNKAPIADAKLDYKMINGGTEVTFNASNSKDEDGEIVSYEWRKNGVVISDRKKFRYLFTEIGQYVVVLKVTDNDGASNETEITIQIEKEIIEGDGFFKLFKTGQKTCYKPKGLQISGIWQETDCSNPEAIGEDGKYQYGAEHKFIKTNDIVTDTITGLQWQDNNNIGSDFSHVNSLEESIQICKNSNLGNMNDWRVPVMEELETLMDYGQENTVLNPIFQYGKDDIYATPGGWYVDFKSGRVFKGDINLESTPYIRYRCVRGKMIKGNLPLKHIQNGTVYDPNTNLLWIDHNMPYLKWTKAKEFCETLDYSGIVNWRMPNIKELRTLVDNSGKLKNGFTTTVNDRFWSSTTPIDHIDKVYVINFSEFNGEMKNTMLSKYNAYVTGVRCVTSVNVGQIKP